MRLSVSVDDMCHLYETCISFYSLLFFLLSWLSCEDTQGWLCDETGQLLHQVLRLSNHVIQDNADLPGKCLPYWPSEYIWKKSSTVSLWNALRCVETPILQFMCKSETDVHWCFLEILYLPDWSIPTGARGYERCQHRADPWNSDGGCEFCATALSTKVEIYLKCQIFVFIFHLRALAF